MPMHSEEKELRPVPDPTVLTTEALHREISSLQVLVDSKLANQDKFFAEKFDSAERHRIELKTDSQTQLTVAFTSANNAIIKVETAFDKRFEEQGKLILSNNAANDAKLVALKERMDRGEGHNKGVGDSWGWIVGSAGILLAIATFVFELINRGH